MTHRSTAAAVAALLFAGACSSGGDTASTSIATPSTPAPTAATAPGTGTAPVAPSTAPTAAESTTTVPESTTSAIDSGGPTTEPSTDGATTTTATTLRGTTTPPADLTDAQLADQALARSALIAIDSFPDGWIEAPNTGDGDDDTGEFEAQFDSCLGRDDEQRIGDDLEPLTVSTGDFQPADDESTTVSHEVVLAPDAPTAITAMSEVSVDGAEPCLADVIQRFYESFFADDPELAGIGVGDVTVTRAAGEQPADVMSAIVLEIPLTIDGQNVSQFLEVLYQRQGRALSELSFTSLGAPFDREGFALLADEVTIGLTAIGS